MPPSGVLFMYTHGGHKEDTKRHKNPKTICNEHIEQTSKPVGIQGFSTHAEMIKNACNLTVNRSVVGSSPTGGATKTARNPEGFRAVSFFSMYKGTHLQIVSGSGSGACAASIAAENREHSGFCDQQPLCFRVSHKDDAFLQSPAALNAPRPNNVIRFAVARFHYQRKFRRNRKSLHY